jgi:hypothetical protein
MGDGDAGFTLASSHSHECAYGGWFGPLLRAGLWFEVYFDDWEVEKKVGQDLL